MRTQPTARTMPTRQVGSGELRVSTMSFGAAAIGNLYRLTSDDDADAAVAAAWDVGVRYFDTAPHYGLGMSERRLGGVLKSYPREQIVVSTKVGRLLIADPDGADKRDPEGFDVPASHRRIRDYSRDGVLRSLEASLKRLGLDRVDVVYVHDPDDHWEAASQQAVPALVELREQGVIGAIGVGMNQAEMLAAFVEHTDVNLVMLAGRYTLLEQGALDTVLPLALERNVGVVNAAVFNSGMLAHDRPPAHTTYDYVAAPGELIARANLIADVCEQHGVTLPAAAVQFSLLHPAVLTVTLGCRTAEQVWRNAALFDAPVPAQLWTDLRARELIRADTPIGDRAQGRT